jgi:hypothetical protein
MTNYTAVPNPKVPHTSAQAVKVTVTGDAALAAKLIGAINWSALHAQLDR